MLHLQNLSSLELVEGPAPWEFGPENLENVPAVCLKDKTKRDAWANLPATRWYMWSMYEGTNPRLRVRTDGKTNDGEDNPPVSQWCVAVDADVPLTPEEAIKYVGAMKGYKPAWFEQTLSGHGRFVWLFKVPVKHVSREFVKYFMSRIGELLELNLIPGIDQPALTEPGRYFTNGARWTKLSDDAIPEEALVGFTLKVAEKFNWERKELGKAVSLEAVAEECRRRYPKFAEWPGEFKDSAQGPTFWIDGSTSPKSAIVHLTGMHTFSAHATKGFYPWSEIVGAKFVEDTENKTMGNAVKDIFYDGQRFFLRDASGLWRDESRESIRLALHVAHGLSTRGKQGQASDVDRALHFITSRNRIDGAACCAFYPKGIFNYQGKKILNMHERDVLAPAEELTPWGPTGKFPTLCLFLDNAFTSDDQLPYLLARIKRGYIACRERKPVQSQGLIFCGPPDKGKTFLSRAIIGALGGFAEAGSYFSGADNFNSELFDVAAWVMDDGTGLSSEMLHRIMSERTKQSLANSEHRVNEKFRKAVMVPWSHFIVLTCNSDPESLRGMPTLDQSNREKFLIFRMRDDSPFQFLPRAQMEEVVARELPYLLKWLLQYEPPAFVTEGASPRWGMNSYCEPSLLRSANQSTVSNAFCELLTKWLREFFQENPGLEWSGTATDLRVAMAMNPAYAELLRPYRHDGISRALAQIQSRGMLKIDMQDKGDDRIWAITRNEKFNRPPPPPVAEPSGPSRFEKP